MALISPPPPKVEPFSFAPLHRQNTKQHKPNSNALMHYGFHTKLIHITPKDGFFLQWKSRVMIPIVKAVSEDEKDSNFSKILFSDRKWNSMDVATIGVVIAMHLLCLFAPFTFSFGALWVALGLYVITGLFGITLSFHRNLSHRSFKLPKWLEYFFAYCGAQALQGNPIDWVSTHRYHHQFVDSDRDPHSPIEGFWFSHMGWLFDTNAILERCGNGDNVGDLEKQPFYKFLRNTYVVHPIALGILLYALGGFPYIVWGMGVRIV